MLKGLFLSLIFVICTAVGVIKRQEFKNRKDELECMIIFTEYVKNEILYRNTPLNLIINDERVLKLGQFFRNLSSSEKTQLYDRYDEVKTNYLNSSSLTVDDIQCLDRLFSLLGKTQEEDQIKLLDNVINELVKHRNDSVSDFETKGSVSVKIGIAVGLFAVMICI